MTALVFILLLSLLVIIHELGHFLVARAKGIKVQEFGFGYPPRLLKLFRWRGALFTLNAIPFGGFVKLEGEEFDPSDSNRQSAPGAFYAKSVLTRMGVVVAGPIANILYGVIAFSVVFGLVGVPQSLHNRPRIDEVSPGSPAAMAGVQPGYEITGFVLPEFFVATPTINDVQKFLADKQNGMVMMTVVGPCQALQCPEQKKESIAIALRSAAETPVGQGKLGIIFADYYLETGPWYQRIPRGIAYGVQETLALGGVIVQALGGLVKSLAQGKLPADLAGPVGIVHQASENHLLSQGWAPLLEFSGMLSINLGIMNLLPIPALDGGRLLLIALEKVIGKRRIQNVEGYVHYGGFIVLLGLIILVSIRDIMQLF